MTVYTGGSSTGRNLNGQNICRLPVRQGALFWGGGGGYSTRAGKNTDSSATIQFQ